jgi:hypothetical protein
MSSKKTLLLVTREEHYLDQIINKVGLNKRQIWYLTESKTTNISNKSHLLKIEKFNLFKIFCNFSLLKIRKKSFNFV